MSKATNNKPVEKGPEPEPIELKELTIEEMVELIDKVDGEFAAIGGTTKDWVEKALMPALKERKIYLVTKQ